MVHTDPYIRNGRGEDSEAVSLGDQRRDTSVVGRHNGVARATSDGDESDMPQRIVVGPCLRVCFPPVVIDLLVGVNDV